MTENEYIIKVGHINSFIRYAKRCFHIIDWYADYRPDRNGIMIPYGVVVACDIHTFNRLVEHGQRYYSDLIISAMTVPTFIAREVYR